MRSGGLGGTVCALVIAVLLLNGCASAARFEGSESSASPATPSLTIPSEGQPLTSLGFTQGPSDLIWLPPNTELTFTADQPNALIAVGPATQAEAVETYLRQTLPGLGWQITASGDGGLLFERGDWQGGYALGQSEWALTVRND